MQTINLTHTIMQRVALREKKRIRRVMEISFSLSAVLIITLLFALYKTISRMVEIGVVDMITVVEIDWESIRITATDVATIIWNETEKQAIALILISSVALRIIFSRSDISSLKRRFKQIDKYIN